MLVISISARTANILYSAAFVFFKLYRWIIRSSARLLHATELKRTQPTECVCNVQLSFNNCLFKINNQLKCDSEIIKLRKSETKTPTQISICKNIFNKSIFNNNFIKMKLTEKTQSGPRCEIFGDREFYVNQFIRTCYNRHGPCQQIVMRWICVVQPKIVFGAGQHIGKLNFIADFLRWDCCIWCRIAKRWIVVQSIWWVFLAQIARYFNDNVSCRAYLRRKRKKKKKRANVIVGITRIS